nr:acyltransferase [Lachnospiraceae bacterium]
MQQQQKLDFVNGLKALACLMVFNFHFIHFYYCGMYSLAPADFHAETFELLIGKTPLCLLIGGKFAVRIFLVISGFFVGYRFFLTGDRRSLTAGAVKKYFRLVFPILTANIAIYACMKLGLYMNGEATAMAGSRVFAGNYNQFTPSLLGAVKEAVWGCFLTGENQYNGPIWCMTYEFLGTLLVAAVLSLVGNSKVRYVVYAVMLVIFMRSDFLAVICGMMVCDLTYRQPAWLKKLTGQKWLMWLMLLAGIFLGSYPSIGERLEGTVYALLPPHVMFYYAIAAACILFALLHLKAPQKVLGVKALTWLHTYSYAFFLTHFMVLCTFSCGFYLAFREKMNYHVLAAVNYVLSFALTLAISVLVHKFAEKPGMKFANQFADQFCNE